MLSLRNGNKILDMYHQWVNGKDSLFARFWGRYVLRWGCSFQLRSDPSYAMLQRR